MKYNATFSIVKNMNFISKYKDNIRGNIICYAFYS